ncbi:DNA adenine methylase [Rhodococcus sp. IEGM 1374]|uniref:DNA adenine methylase n=1 Tax=Rhodococcus sp. IEGM 1374 TaxID=3082221 RepID=UPI002953EDB4|nr:DNA adenine methylase [Rhodococcus sp. IEGM 1374]MDV7992090.1 DNA adenine methylase [Rhodococcus sp. IEGM 1374]
MTIVNYLCLAHNDMWNQAKQEQLNMKYMGSKARHAKEILKIVLAQRSPTQTYVEPFMGGGNVIHLVNGPRIGNDTNGDVVALLKAVSEGWTPPTVVSVDEYMYAQRNPHDLEPHLRAFIAIGASYSGKWFGGYARGKDSKGIDRNYARESADNILKQAAGLSGVQFQSVSYDEIQYPDNSLIYCDPPYANTTKYRSSFDSDKFWRWCDYMVESGHTIFVSEYNAPVGWDVVWQKQVNSSLTKDTGSKSNVEKLFTRQRDDVAAAA